MNTISEKWLDSILDNLRDTYKNISLAQSVEPDFVPEFQPFELSIKKYPVYDMETDTELRDIFELMRFISAAVKENISKYIVVYFENKFHYGDLKDRSKPSNILEITASWEPED